MIQPDDPFNVQFTSGTTGAPKVATLTHTQILNNAQFQAEVMGVGEGDRFCNRLPLYHTGGTVCGAMMGIVREVTLAGRDL